MRAHAGAQGAPFLSGRASEDTHARRDWQGAWCRIPAEAGVTFEGTREPGPASHIPVCPGAVHDRLSGRTWSDAPRREDHAVHRARAWSLRVRGTPASVDGSSRDTPR